jgi:hypothetical protein
MRARVPRRGRTANETTASSPAAASEAAGSAPVKDAAAMPSNQAKARNASVISLGHGYERLNVCEDGLGDDTAGDQVIDRGKRAFGGARLNDAAGAHFADAG